MVGGRSRGQLSGHTQGPKQRYGAGSKLDDLMASGQGFAKLRCPCEKHSFFFASTCDQASARIECASAIIRVQAATWPARLTLMVLVLKASEDVLRERILVNFISKERVIVFVFCRVMFRSSTGFLSADSLGAGSSLRSASRAHQFLQVGVSPSWSPAASRASCCPSLLLGTPREVSTRLRHAPSTLPRGARPHLFYIRCVLKMFAHRVLKNTRSSSVHCLYFRSKKFVRDSGAVRLGLQRTWKNGKTQKLRGHMGYLGKRTCGLPCQPSLAQRPPPGREGGVVWRSGLWSCG